MNVKKPLKIGELVPEYARDPKYPKHVKWEVTHINWNYNGTYYAIYLNGCTVLASCEGKSIDSICADTAQRIACKKAVSEIKQRNRFQSWRKTYHRDYPVWDLNNLYIRFTQQENK